MDIETAANIGEAVSGVAILFTLLFSLRQNEALEREPSV
jgi:hypothetical protein